MRVLLAIVLFVVCSEELRAGEASQKVVREIPENNTRSVAVSGETPPHGDKLHVRMGYSSKILSNVDKKDAVLAIKAWAENQSHEEGETFSSDVESYDTIPEIVQALKAKVIDLVVVSPLDYLRIQDSVDIVPELIGLFDESPFEEETLLVHRDSGINSLKQLDGKRLIVEKMMTGDAALLWLETEFLKMGLGRCARLLASVKTVEKVSQAVLPVFFGKADACLVREQGFAAMVKLNPQTGAELKILLRSPKLLRWVACYRPDYDLENKKRLRRAATKLPETVRGRQILALFKTERIADFAPDFLQSTIALKKEHEALLGGKNP